jgi:hypothetical protein
MADSRVKKVVIENSDLPPVDSNGEYFLRYRIVSEDRNRTSHWSPVYNIDPAYELDPVGALVVEKNQNHVLIIWNPANIKKDESLIKKIKEYDVWLKWHRSDSGDWQFFERIDGTSLTLIPSTTYSIGGVQQENIPNRLDVEIYLVSSSTERSEDLLIYSKYNTTIS